MEYASCSMKLSYPGEPTKKAITVPEESLLDSFRVNFHCTKKFLQPFSSTENSTSEPPLPHDLAYDSCSSWSTTHRRLFLVPWSIMLDKENSKGLQETFSSVPIPGVVLDWTLPGIREFAREIKDETEFDWDNYRVWQIDVDLRVYITIIDEEEDYNNEMNEDCDCESVELTSFDKPCLWPVTQERSFLDRFYINFYCTNRLIQHGKSTSKSSIDEFSSFSSNTFHGTFLVPWDKLGSYLEPTVTTTDVIENFKYFQETFSSIPMPTELLNLLVPYIGKFAREMMKGYEGYEGIWYIDVNLRVTTHVDCDDNGDHKDDHCVMETMSESYHDSASCVEESVGEN
ncbi:hypothetical protein PIB30_069148 [Stylosanthes scabra]|uniref:Uncharacterized protein n=1 Tax=Stylosanthes scabra TaxID=79078 RepID=A0ABU6WP36_9FABA|nr:hypothetical protein [Stylosanthes scabra]